MLAPSGMKKESIEEGPLETGKASVITVPLLELTKCGVCLTVRKVNKQGVRELEGALSEGGCVEQELHCCHCQHVFIYQVESKSNYI